MINTATSFLALLRDDSLVMKKLAINKIELIVDDYWAEIADYIKEFEYLYQNKIIVEQNNQIALIISKLYFHLEAFPQAIEWALEAKEKFNISEKNQYTKAILNKIIDKYISIRKHNFYALYVHKKNDESVEQEIDERITSIMTNIFLNCIDSKDYRQAIGMCIDSYDLGRIIIAVEKSDNMKAHLQHVYIISQNLIQNKTYKNALLQLILSLYQKYFPKEYHKIIQIQFLLKNIDSMAKTMVNILLEEEEPLAAYQIALDLYDNQNNYFLQELFNKIEQLEETKEVIQRSKPKYENLKGILFGKIQKNVENQCMIYLNKANSKTFEELKKGVEKCGSTPALGVIFAHSLMYARTQDDTVLKQNKDWMGKMTNWCRFAATASLGIVHLGNTEKGKEVITPYLPGSQLNPSIYAQSGAYYALGLIYQNTNNPEILELLNKALTDNSNNNETMLHGILLAHGLVSMGSSNEQAYTKQRDFMYKDDNAIIGEAATYSIGLSMLGSKNPQVVEDLYTYAHETQHEKIIRAISISLGLIMYGAEEEADELIEKMILEKDPIIRYGAMYVIGLAYAGTSNPKAFRMLINFSVQDVNDDVRRAALINVGFIYFKNPHLLIEKIKVMQLYADSYNPHVRYGTCLSLGIACIGTHNTEAFEIIEPLLNDLSPLVRQGAYIAGAMIYSQMNPKNDPKFDLFKENLDKVNNNKEDHNLIKLGTLIGQGFLELGGRNANLSLVSHTGHNRIGAIIGIALFTQYYYWYPMMHFISLAIRPQIHMGIDSDFKVIKNFKIISKSKPSQFGYPSETKIEDKKEKTEAPKAVLSSQTRMLAKNKSKLGTNSNLNTQTMHLDKQVSTTQDIKIEENKMEIDDNIKKEEKPVEEKKEEPLEELLSNPCRILKKQEQVIEFIYDQCYLQVTPTKYCGIIMLKKVANDEPEYLELKPIEDKKEEKKPESKPSVSNTGNYQSVPIDEVEIPDEFDQDLLGKKN